MDQPASLPHTPVRPGASSVPHGHVIVNERWMGSELVTGLQGGVTAVFEDGLGLVDFHVSKQLCVFYISESDLVAGHSYKRKLVQFRNASSLHGAVLVERTGLSDQYFPAVQRFVVLELGLTLLPVAGQAQASQLLVQMVQEASKEPGHNPFLRRSFSRPAEAALLVSVQQIPGVGKVKAAALLQRFLSLQQLSQASPRQLEAQVGRLISQHVNSFFCQEWP